MSNPFEQPPIPNPEEKPEEADRKLDEIHKEPEAEEMLKEKSEEVERGLKNNPDSEEKEQGAEEILKDLEWAIENRSEALLKVLGLDGKSSIEGIVTPEFFEDDVLWVTTETGEGMAIETMRIKKVELPKEPTEEKE